MSLACFPQRKATVDRQEELARLHEAPELGFGLGDDLSDFRQVASAKCHPDQAQAFAAVQIEIELDSCARESTNIHYAPEDC